MRDLYIKRKNKKYRGGTGVLPKALFVITAILGSVAVWILKSYNVDPLVTISIPVSLIVIYCGLAWLVPLFYIREDQIGDNAYYLGFLFTLASLAYALWRFQMDKGNADPADIIGSFGIALWSTIIGIALRVFFSQLRQDPHDIEKETRVKIAQTASLLSSDLHQAAVTFNTYTRGLQQAVDEVFLKAQEVSTNTLKALEDLNARMETVETPNSLINRKVDSIFSDLEGATNKLNTLAGQQIHSVESLIGSSKRLESGIDALNNQIVNMKDNTVVVNSSSQDMQKVSDLVCELQTALKGLSTGLSDLSSQQSDAVRSISQHADAMSNQLERSRKYTEDTHHALASMTKTLTEKLQ